MEMNDILPFEAPSNGGVPSNSAENSSNICKSRSTTNDSSTPLLEKPESAPKVTKV
jgi:hypothetical protein